MNGIIAQLAVMALGLILVQTFPGSMVAGYVAGVVMSLNFVVQLLVWINSKMRGEWR
jgi:hypothetical protein